MATAKNERKINSLLRQMEQQTGFDAYKKKAEAEKQKASEFSDLVRNLAQLEQQDPMRVAPVVNENNRDERAKEDQRHKERQNVMRRVYQRQHARSQRTYS
ncbi:MAG: hypothetical protein IJ677_00920 [Alphaproteobacteria bacterium]|nr:hypothetical protein [Alphaproteobacteria bacterium]